MELLKGLLIINGKDVFNEYGAFLTEDSLGSFSNYEELLKPASMKPYTTVAFREDDGESLPDVLPSPRFEARDVTLYFAIIGDSQAKWFSNYQKFVTLLKSGWLNIRVPELNRTFKMYYSQCSQYTQLTPFELPAGKGAVISTVNQQQGYAAKLKVRLREPNPSV